MLKKKFPWVSLMLLLGAYLTFGKFLFSSSYPWIAWLIASSCTLFIATVLLIPSFNLHLIYGWLQSDAFSFVVLMLAAALLSVVMLWFQTFLQILIIVAAEALLRLDLHRFGLNQSKSFLLLITTSFTGLGFAWIVR